MSKEADKIPVPSPEQCAAEAAFMAERDYEEARIAWESEHSASSPRTWDEFFDAEAEKKVGA